MHPLCMLPVDTILEEQNMNSTLNNEVLLNKRSSSTF